MFSSAPPLKIKILFCLMLGVFSTYFAEVASGSTLFAFTTSFGLLFVFPIYALHVTVLSAIVFRFGKPRFYTLYAAGTLLGMYEAYMTKILWISFLPGGPLIRVGGLGLIEVFVLVFFWHPLMAFIVPLGISERLLTSSTTIPLPRFQRRTLLWVLFAVLLGANQAVYSHSALRSLGAGAISFVVLCGFTVLWRKAQLHRYELPALLPRGKVLAVAAALLLADYLIVTRTIRPEQLPGLKPQLSVWALYACLLLLFLAHLRKSRNYQLNGAQAAFSLQSLAALLVIMAIASTIVAAVLSGLSGFGAVVFPLLLAMSSLAGIFLIVMATTDLLRKRPVLRPDRSMLARAPITTETLHG